VGIFSLDQTKSLNSGFHLFRLVTTSHRSILISIAHAVIVFKPFTSRWGEWEQHDDEGYSIEYRFLREDNYQPIYGLEI
jgi:hypothetical protein